MPHTRDASVRDGRAGAPLWQLIDFRDHVDTAHRAGLEAALEAAGLLDAWVAPDGQLQSADGSVLHDTQALSRPHQLASLADWLHPAALPLATVDTGVIAQVLAGVACGEHDPIDAEAWIAPDGRFRFGALAGAWSKPDAVYVGCAAARSRRFAEITGRLEQLADERATLQTKIDEHAAAERQAAEEWRKAPSDEALHKAHISAAACARDFQHARERLAAADAQYREAQQTLRAARQKLADAAADLRLPEAVDALRAIEAALGRFDEAQQLLGRAAHDLRTAMPELQRQQAREAEANADRAKNKPRQQQQYRGQDQVKTEPGEELSPEEQRKRSPGKSHERPPINGWKRL
jgi:predicted  nucleic acid-binding Zn-ribbon protein